MPNWPTQRLGQSLRLGIAADGLALLRVRGLLAASSEVLAVQPVEAGAPDALANGLRALLQEAAPHGWPVTVVLADELVHLWQVPPPGGASRLGDLQAAAAFRFQGLFGAPAHEWRISADWHASRPFLAAAVPTGLVELLEVLAREHRFTLVEVVPQFVAAMNAWRRERRPGAWFGLVHGGVLSLAAFEGMALAAVRTAVIPAGIGRDWLEAHVAREALRVGVGRPERLQLCGAVPAGWAISAAHPEFACTLLEDDSAGDWPLHVRLARTGIPA
ncbi:hypothetical protein [Telluria aromaticivorans]|uniref:Uncharacterized protein n=1 Tax=Telluria aromaticivorans TaxID=2725995 RepID=A0A7Y2JZI4_9BURK|nr:hypothetical protein [Telluria aromaticivorans]NNG23781.1 hypothetical protein [Telluria aromaticivorans]